ncbi:hypothetical protein WR25_19914 [Diploscapter pachys]|uniref:Rad4 beta-hairpin domain-containing protein n=1 Tax=Diploscapter pachys TaxID=2018661 RepID=A0A2A2LYA1_9BILA|nr:hypothetical protein WR25_19914 [Diploscapter pachys]
MKGRSKKAAVKQAKGKKQKEENLAEETNGGLNLSESEEDEKNLKEQSEPAKPKSLKRKSSEVVDEPTSSRPKRQSTEKIKTNYFEDEEEDIEQSDEWSMESESNSRKGSRPLSRNSDSKRRKAEENDDSDIEEDWEMEEEKPKRKVAKKRSTESKPKEKKPAGPKVIKKKPEQPWKKAMEGADGKMLSKGEEKMRQFRILARSIARGRTKETSYEECVAIHKELKAQREAEKKKKKTTNAIIEVIKERVDEELEKEASSEDEWEDMEILDDGNSNDGTNKKIEVTVEIEKESEEKDWWAQYLKQEVNKCIRENWEDAHKCHILCYLAHLRYVRRISVEENLLPALLVSQLPTGFLNAKLNLKSLKRLVGWFLDAFRQSSEDLKIEKPDDLQSRMAYLAENRTYETDRDIAMLLFAMLVGLEAPARICANALVISRKVGGEDENLDRSRKQQKRKHGYSDFWVEFWDKEEKRWISVDPNTKTVDKSDEIEPNTSLPIRYIFGIDNQGGIREISCRYAANYYTQEFRRQRTEIAWLGAVLRIPMISSNPERAQLEDAFFDQNLASKPLPTKISEYKNHPLYVLEKDLLKFEAIYPPPDEQKPLGEIRGHKVFPRSTVYTLQGDLNWLKLARSIKEGEKPYKIVKARPDLRVPVEEREQKFLNVYGFWQTEPFRPPTVENGRIPRNQYGNVYLYQPKMCPIGAVHLKLNGIVNIARRLNKEAVAAVVGWDFNGCNHPVIDGAVVLKEDADELVEEWERIESEREAKEEEKRLKSVYGNWRRMIRGILRLNYVRKKFGQENRQNEASTERQTQDRDAEEGETSRQTSKNIIDNTTGTQKLNFSLDRLKHGKK